MALRFRSPKILTVYLETNNPRGVTYTFSLEHLDTYVVSIDDFGELGRMNGDVDFNFILHTSEDEPNELFFSADVSMHYKMPLQLTTLKAHASTNTYIP
ncbi:hypothetical protein G4O51_10855 [Candidatus Bathyarchaeota archaeon A05DMB-2]|jgi:hypothetical protein|nr:hypothetical protein [Candidatus Bathyarchaeota archaeon A05DMB-2]